MNVFPPTCSFRGAKHGSAIAIGFTGSSKKHAATIASNALLRTPNAHLNACVLIFMAAFFARLPSILLLLLQLQILPASCNPDQQALISWADSIGFDSSNITLQSPTIFEGWGVRASRRILKGEIFM
jgi:hypothetical protein